MTEKAKNLVIDAGNTYYKMGWFVGDQLVSHKVRLTESEIAAEIARHQQPEQVIFSSVNRRLEDFKRVVQLSGRILHLTPETPVPILKNYESQKSLGMDRVAAAVGAMTIRPGENLVVIDMGTCITYDLVSAAGSFEGGLISPGVRMRFKAMHQFTGRLPEVGPEGIPPLIGKNTKACMQSGVMNGILAEVEGIIASYRREAPDLSVVICGGDAPFFESRLKLSIFAVPELVLTGLNRILQHNVALQQN